MQSDIDSNTEDLAQNVTLHKFMRLVCIESDEKATKLEASDVVRNVLHSNGAVFRPISQSEHSSTALFDPGDGKVTFILTIEIVTQLCTMVDDLTKELGESIVPAFRYYESRLDSDLDYEQESKIVDTLSQYLPHLSRCSHFVGKCYQIFRRMLQQLCIFYAAPKSVQLVHATTPLTYYYDKMCQILIALHTVSILLPRFERDFNIYRRLVHNAQQNPDKYDTDRQTLVQMNVFLERLDVTLFNSSIIQNCLEQPIMNADFENQLKCESALSKQFLNQVKIYLAECEASVNTNIPAHKAVLLFQAHCVIFKSLNKHTAQAIWALTKKTPIITHLSSIDVPLRLYLITNIKDFHRIVDEKQILQAQTLAKEFERNFINVAVRDETLSRVRINDWIASMYEVFAEWPQEHDQTVDETVKRRLALCNRGLNNATSILTCVYFIFSQIQNFVGNEMAMNKSLALTLMNLLVLIKETRHTFDRLRMQLTETLQHAQQCSVVRLMKIVWPVREALCQYCNKNTKEVENFYYKYDFFTLLESCLQRPITTRRFYAMQACTVFADINKILRSTEIKEINKIFAQMKQVLTIEQRIDKATDVSQCNVTAFNSLLKALITDLYQFDVKSNIVTPLRTHFPIEIVVSMINDFLDMYQRTDCSERNVADSETEMYVSMLMGLVDHCVAWIDNFLRISMSSSLNNICLTNINERRKMSLVAMRIEDYLAIMPLRLRHKIFDVKRLVERRLDSLLYSHATVAPHEAAFYDSMRLLAQQRFGLCLIESRVPVQPRAHVLDLLMVMRRMNVFAQNYSYNINTQCFVERFITGTNKYLNTLTIELAETSIRVHGNGIINTTVNYAYKYLRQKLQVVSQFLLDDQIRGKLINDRRFYERDMEKLEYMYPVKRAYKFNVDIKKFGLTAEGLTHLDQFRMLLTHMGNCLGYVRLVRSAGIKHDVALTEPLFELPPEEEVNFVNLAQELENQSVTDACRQFNEVFSKFNIRRLLAAQHHFFKLLVDVFAGELLNDSKHPHLALFYIVLPSLTINYIEHMITSKEHLRKSERNGKKTQEFLFTDDGFSMGVAYLLQLFNQNEKFDSLNWFKSLYADIAMRKSKLQPEQQAIGKKLRDKKSQIDNDLVRLSHTHHLTRRRLKAFEREVRACEWAMRSSRIFFGATLSQNADEKPVERTDADIHSDDMSDASSVARSS